MLSLWLIALLFSPITINQSCNPAVVDYIIRDEKGKVLSATDMCQGPPFLTEAAINSAMKARFTPTLLYGQPVKVTGVIVYNFRFR